MRTHFRQFSGAWRSAFTGLAVALAVSRPAAAPGATLDVEIQPRWSGAPLAFDVLTNTTAAGQRVSVTRLDFLLSDFALRRSDGTWATQTNWFAHVNGREGRTSFSVEHLPSGSYDRVRFHVGVPAKENHADPAGFAAEHPLNPNVNGLHWNWQGGYVFLAIEGNRSGPERGLQAASVSEVRGTVKRPEGRAPVVSGYSWHVATDRLLMTVELPVALDLATDGELHLALNVERIFSAQRAIQITDETTSTHSRADDKLADQLRENIERAFTVDAASVGAQPRSFSLSPFEGERAGVRGNVVAQRAPIIASNATPYRFTFSRFFPQPALPLDNPLTEEGVELGRRLFHDPRLSINNQQSCASCHQAGAAFTDAGKRFSIGAEGQPGTRNAMPLFNLAWKNSFFWDGRAPTLREQALMPIENPVEMHETLSNVVAKLEARSLTLDALSLAPGFSPVTGASEANSTASAVSRRVETVSTAATPNSGLKPGANESGHGGGLEEYPIAFAATFGSPDITADRIARALEQFLLTQVSHGSKFDRSLAGEAELSEEERRGFGLFHTEYDPRRGQFGADCFHCHGGPLFQSQGFANNGLDTVFADLGRFDATKKDGDKGKFAVPSLRNVALTAPYMHDGRFATLEEVVEHYSTGVKRSATLDPNLAKHPDGGVPLSSEDKRALVAFLKTLTDERFIANRGKLAQAP